MRALSHDTASHNNEIPLNIRLAALQKEYDELKLFNEICVDTLRRQGDWKKYYQDLSKDNRELRRELERWQKRISPVELAIRHGWARPTTYLRNLPLDFTERELEEYLWYQLEIVEPGLRFCGEEVSCGNGIIDLVAEDRYSKHVLIELKAVDDDRKLLDQVVRYPEAYSTKFSVSMEDIRMMAIAPNYNEIARQELLKVGVTLSKYVNSADGFAITKA